MAAVIDPGILQSVHRGLEEDGVIQSLKIQLRLHVCKFLQRRSNSVDSNTSGSAAVDLAPSRDDMIRSTREMLQLLNLQNTLRTFDREVGVGGDLSPPSETSSPPLSLQVRDQHINGNINSSNSNNIFISNSSSNNNDYNRDMSNGNLSLSSLSNSSPTSSPKSHKFDETFPLETNGHLSSPKGIQISATSPKKSPSLSSSSSPSSSAASKEKSRNYEGSSDSAKSSPTTSSSGDHSREYSPLGSPSLSSSNSSSPYLNNSNNKSGFSLGLVPNRPSSPKSPVDSIAAVDKKYSPISHRSSSSNEAKGSNIEAKGSKISGDEEDELESVGEDDMNDDPFNEKLSEGNDDSYNQSFENSFQSHTSLSPKSASKNQLSSAAYQVSNPTTETINGKASSPKARAYAKSHSKLGESDSFASEESIEEYSGFDSPVKDPPASNVFTSVVNKNISSANKNSGTTTATTAAVNTKSIMVSGAGDTGIKDPEGHRVIAPPPVNKDRANMHIVSNVSSVSKAASGWDNAALDASQDDFNTSIIAYGDESQLNNSGYSERSSKNYANSSRVDANESQLEEDIVNISTNDTNNPKSKRSDDGDGDENYEEDYEDEFEEEVEEAVEEDDVEEEEEEEEDEEEEEEEGDNKFEDSQEGKAFEDSEEDELSVGNQDDDSDDNNPYLSDDSADKKMKLKRVQQQKQQLQPYRSLSKTSSSTTLPGLPASRKVEDIESRLAELEKVNPDLKEIRKKFENEESQEQSGASKPASKANDNNEDDDVLSYVSEEEIEVGEADDESEDNDF